MLALVLVGAASLASNACDKVPLLAPSTAAITFTAPAAAGANDAVTVSARILEGRIGTATGQNGQASSTAGGGTPVHNGTYVVFTTTLGTIDPVEARTVDGWVTVTFTGDGRTGKAVITATSGPITKTHEITLQ
jgi:hypothetical protein